MVSYVISATPHQAACWGHNIIAKYSLPSLSKYFLGPRYVIKRKEYRIVCGALMKKKYIYILYSKDSRKLKPLEIVNKQTKGRKIRWIGLSNFYKSEKI